MTLDVYSMSIGIEKNRPKMEKGKGNQYKRQSHGKQQKNVEHGIERT